MENENKISMCDQLRSPKKELTGKAKFYASKIQEKKQDEKQNEKAALLKRHDESALSKKFKPIDYQKRFDTFVDGLLYQTEKQARVKFDIDGMESDEAESLLFSIRSKAVKDINRIITPSLLKRFPDEFKHSKENIFPRGWMKDDRGISKVEEKYTFLMPLLNFIFERTRHLKKMEMEMMQIQTKVCHIKKYPVSYFALRATQSTPPVATPNYPT